MKFRRLVILLASVLFGLLSDRPLPAVEPMETFVFRRWAILPAPEVRDAGLSDLLTAELSRKSIELVEREQLDAVAKEIELAKLLGADAAAQRLKVGQLVKAVRRFGQPVG